ncbi:MAG TPA: tetratricopeptide repeat protein, partial [Stellaceae bacterium]|nr:tetratricopeptide repeat protein [Stellaceae bacterium]
MLGEAVKMRVARLLRLGRSAGACLLLLALAQCSLGGGGYFGAPGRGGDPFEMLAKMAQQNRAARPPAGDAPKTTEQILARQRTTQEQALADAEKRHGPNHPTVASNLAQLGGTYRQLGRYAEAEAMLKRALVIQEKTTADPEMAATLDELARVYVAQGRYGEAEPLLKRSVAIYEEALGPDGTRVRADLSEASAAAGLMPTADLSLPNPEVVMMPSALSSLGEIYAAEGRYDDAERVFKRAAALTDKLFPDLGDAASYGSLFSLASIYAAQDRDTEAEALLKRTLAVQQQWSKQWSAQVDNMMGNLTQEMCESQDMSTMPPAAFQSGFMPCDIDGQPNRGWFKQLQERAAAWQLTDTTLEQTVAASQDVFRAGVLDALAQVYARERRDGEAAPLFDEAVALREQALGPTHPDLAVTLAHRAALYMQEQRPADAIRDARRSSEILRDRAG